MVVFLSAMVLIYSLALCILIIGWIRPVNREIKASGASIPLVSVAIPVRNEKENILLLLDDLEQQDYPKSHFEVIVVDDHSDDGTLQLIRDQKERFSFRLELLTLNGAEGSGSAKKMALSLAVSHALGAYILTTDGDCRIQRGWISAYARGFQQDKPSFLSGMVAFDCRENLFQEIQALEFAALTGVGAASMRLGYPNMCNAANMAFCKKTFMDVGGFHGIENIISGDDSLLLKKFQRHDPSKIRFLKVKEAVVRTAPQQSLSGFYHQRKRWVSKWKRQNPATIAIAVFIFVFHASFLTAGALTIAGVYPAILFLLQWLFKLIFELIFLKKVYTFLEQNMNFVAVAVLEFTYSFYAVFFGIAAHIGGFTWKGRKYFDLAAVKIE